MERFIVLLTFIVLPLIFFINIVIREWDYISSVTSSLDRVRTLEKLAHRTASNQAPKYDYDKKHASSLNNGGIRQSKLI